MIGWIQSTSIHIQYKSINVPLMDELRFTGQFALILTSFVKILHFVFCTDPWKSIQMILAFIYESSLVG